MSFEYLNNSIVVIHEHDFCVCLEFGVESITHKVQYFQSFINTYSSTSTKNFISNINIRLHVTDDHMVLNIHVIITLHV